MRKSKIENGKEIHGNNGLGIDVDFPEPTKTPEEGNAVLNMYMGLKNSGEKVTLCATGSLTNIALLFKTFPDVKDYVDKLIIMGGAVDKGNVNKHAEYNIF
jgi:inosine-uridine nucleoside N-ribohydrolase